jgi:metal-responsive CopG/Arc/MetJ family transcriptional regulator
MKILARVVILGYTPGMKTAISLPDDLFAAADALANRLGMSRSGLIAAALAEYVAKHRASKVTDRLDAVYFTEANELDAGLKEAQRRTLGRQQW